MATRAADGLKPKSSGAVVLLMMSMASCCHFTSMLVVTLRPPSKTLAEPNRLMSTLVT